MKEEACTLQPIEAMSHVQWIMTSSLRHECIYGSLLSITPIAKH